MKIETQTREDHQVDFIVELEPDIQEKFMHRAARKISESGKISGFRPGKAPYDVIKRTYGEKAIEEQALELIIDEFYPKVLEEAGIEPSGPGRIEVIPTMNPPKFSFLVPLKPEITLSDYHSIRQAYQPDPITDEQVNDTLGRLQMNNAIANPVERAAQNNDLVAGLVSASLIDPAPDTNAELYTDQPFEVLLNEEDQNNNPLPFPGFVKELVGLSPNDDKKVIHHFDANIATVILQDKNVEFTIKVQSVKELTLPELNDDFAKSLGEYSTLDELKKAILDEIDKYNLQSYDEEYFNRLIQIITDQATVKYPPHMLEEEIQSVLQEVERNLAYRRLELSAYLKSIDMDKDTYIEKEIMPIATGRLKQSLVMQEIIRTENISVKQDELRSATAKTLGDISKLPVRKLPRGTTKEDYLMAATYQTANALLTQNLKAYLKSIATSTDDNRDEAPETDKSTKKEKVEKPVSTTKKTTTRKQTSGESKT